MRCTGHSSTAPILWTWIFFLVRVDKSKLYSTYVIVIINLKIRSLQFVIFAAGKIL